MIKMKQKNLDAFINDLLNKKNPRSKKQQTELELYTIKQIFYNQKSSLQAIQNAVLKLTYISMMGQSVDFGVEQIELLIKSNQFKMIQIGWLAFVIFDIRDEISLRPLIPILQTQLLSYDNEPIQCLALSVVAQVFCKSILELVGPEVAEIAVSPKSSEFARKRALIISGKIYQATREPHLITVLAPALSVYLDFGSYSIRMATATLTVGLMSSQPGAFSDVFEKVLDQLFQLYNPNSVVESNVISEDYEGTASPWYSKQLIRILRFKASWNFEELSKIDAVAMSLFSRTGEKLSIRPALAYFIVFSEMVSLLSMIPIPEFTTERCAMTLVRYLESDRHYMIYFALDSLNHLFHTNPKITQSIKSSLPILYSLIHSDDGQVVVNSLNLLVHLSTPENSKEIVEKLMLFLQNSPLNIRDLLCAKISLLAQNAQDPVFYIDTVVEMLFEVGERCDDSTWQTAVSLIDSDKDLQTHAIDLTLSYMKKALRPSEQLMKLTVYIAGEYISERANRIVSFISSRFPLQTPVVQSMMVTAMAKICSKYPSFLPKCQQFLKYCAASGDTEVSDRAKQYSMMLDILPTAAPMLMKRMPSNMGDDLLEKMLETVFEVANGEEGVSTFKLDENDEDQFILDENDKLIEDFLLADSGYLYHDMFFRVHLELNFSMPLVRALLSFENNGILPLTDVQLQIFTCDEIRSRSTSFPNVINAATTASFQSEFLYDNITNVFPTLNISFKCGGTEQCSTVLVPIHFAKIIQSANVPPDSFKAQWNSIKNKNLFAETTIQIEGKNPMHEMEILLRKQLGIEPLKLGLPNGQMAGCGVFRSNKFSVGIMIRLVHNPNMPQNVIVHIKASTEKGLQVALCQLKGGIQPTPLQNRPIINDGNLNEGEDDENDGEKDDNEEEEEEIKEDDEVNRNNNRKIGNTNDYYRNENNSCNYSEPEELEMEEDDN